MVNPRLLDLAQRLGKPLPETRPAYQQKPEPRHILPDGYVPFEEAGYAVIPALQMMGEDHWKTKTATQETNNTSMPSISTNLKIAYAVKPDQPTDEFLEYASEFGISEMTASDAYNKLHEQLWKKYWARCEEMLAWKITDRLINKTGRKLEAPLLIRKYNVIQNHASNRLLAKKTYDYAIEVLDGQTVGWPETEGTISRELAQILEVPDNTYVWTNTDKSVQEGLRALYWDFRYRERPLLDSDWYPSDWDPLMGSLLGRVVA